MAAPNRHSHPLPAQLPPPTTRRTDTVEAGVARKVAALFGVAGSDPLHRTWVCDYTTLTLGEIGRGAPNPTRDERARLDTNPPEGDGWVYSGRAVWSHTTLPGTLSNATLNRYGPDTKAAAVLAGANRLLADATDAVAAAARQLTKLGCDPELRLAAWAGLILEVYRAQPALLVAAVQARQVQRALSVRWGQHVDRGQVTGADAPPELHSPATTVEPAGTRWQPTTLNLVDTTLPELQLGADPDTTDDIASAWCERLLRVGQPGRGVLWLAEDSTGSRRVEAALPPGPLIAPFVAATLGPAAGHRAPAPPLPPTPTVGELADAPLLCRRAHLLTAHVLTAYVRHHDGWLRRWPHLRQHTRDMVNNTIDRCGGVLDADDPVVLLLRGYTAYLTVWDHTHAGVVDERARVEAIRQLTASRQQVRDAWLGGRLDHGAVVYLLDLGDAALRAAERL